MSVGSRWYKFDFHNHSPASEDYDVPDLSDREWLLAYMRQEVDALVVTDHNTGSQIDRLKAELAQMKLEAETGDIDGYRPLELFPGVELTATGNVHVLAVFDQSSCTAEIERLIGQCNDGAPIPRGLNHNLVLRSSVPSIVSSIKQYPNAICILAHIDATKGTLSITNHGELNEVFRAKPDAVEIRYELADITDGLHCRLINDLPKLRGSDAHHPDNAGLRTCWLKMSDLDFDGLRNALLDHENCVLLDSMPPSEPELQIRKLRLKTKLCRSVEGNEVELEFNPFYNAVIGSRGSGKSTIIESIRLALRKDIDLSNNFTQNLANFKKVGKGMSADSSVECYYQKDGHDFRFTWRSDSSTNLQRQSVEGWVDDEHWSSERFGVSIYSQKMLYDLASNTDAFLKVCDESKVVSKRQWDEKKEELERLFKNEKITLRGLQAKQKTSSALNGQLEDVSRSISKLSESSYYTVKTKLTELEVELTTVSEFVSSELELLDILQSQVSSGDCELREDSTEYHQNTVKQVNEVRQKTSEQMKSLIDSAREQYNCILSGDNVSELKSLIQAAKDDVVREASILREQGLEPETLDELVEQKKNIELELRDFSNLDSQISESEQQIQSTLIEIKNHRKLLTTNRKSFIDSLNLDGLEIKILPLNAPSKLVTKSYQEASGISAFSDRIYDDNSKTGFLKDFIEFPTFDPREELIEQKYTRLEKIRGLHIDIVKDTLTEDIDIHGAYRNRIDELSDEALDNLMCWFPDDGIRIRYEALSGSMENIDSASPGQKAASMLQFLLSYGTDPLLLDQPEDDLDCLMLSASVIPAIVANKQRRQLIIVSHSAPIVVNGDAEYVISMLHDKNGLRPNVCGSLQTQSVKDTILNQMEGGEKAFRSRFSRILS